MPLGPDVIRRSGSNQFCGLFAQGPQRGLLSRSRFDRFASRHHHPQFLAPFAMSALFQFFHFRSLHAADARRGVR
jgi:hypothetical protein